MKVTVAPDSLKESLDAPAAAEAIARGVRAAAPRADVIEVPMADGGEGTVRALLAATGGRRAEATVTDPLGQLTRAAYGLWDGGRSAVIEMAAASGLPLLRPKERDPLRTSTRGTGELIRATLDAGARRIIIGVGGSATVDGGTGMAASLGVRFINRAGKPIEQPCGGTLEEVARIDPSGLDPRLRETRIEVACDVDNPLLGPDGAARVYGPQKGADAAGVERLEGGLANLAEVVERDLGRDVRSEPGAGAAGGLGAGLAAFLGAELRSGVNTVLETVGLKERVAGSDMVLTAEGRADGQSACGKVPAGVGRLAAAQGIPVVVLAGAIGPGHERLRETGIIDVFCICDGPLETAEAMGRAAELLQRTAEAVTRLWLAAGRPTPARWEEDHERT